jgi:hypothetical protein
MSSVNWTSSKMISVRYPGLPVGFMTPEAHAAAPVRAGDLDAVDADAGARAHPLPALAQQGHGLRIAFLGMGRWPETAQCPVRMAVH